MALSTCALLLVLLTSIGKISARYEPNWDSLDTRPSPSWYDEAKIGIFIHWGVFSVPSLTSEWFWQYWQANRSTEVTDYIKNNFPPGFSYQEFARDFTAEFFNATQWANIFAKSGAKYVVLTSKHHEGFTLWPSKYSFSWNAKDIGPHRDLVGELGEAIRKTNLKYGLYHSMFEWFNPLWLADQENNFKTKHYVHNKVLPELYELVNTYKPSILWSDGDIAANDTYWESTDFLAWLYNDSPVKDEVLTNDRWGALVVCNHGDFITCHDRYDPGTVQKKKWENAMTLDKHSWGFRRNAKLEDYLTISELLSTLARTVSCGGNLLINVGPTKDGIISTIFEERLTQLGEWLDLNGEAIYKSKPWIYQNDSLNENVWYTAKDNVVYAITLKWPKDNAVVLKSVETFVATNSPRVSLLGNNGDLRWAVDNGHVKVYLPNKAGVKSTSAWVLKFYV